MVKLNELKNFFDDVFELYGFLLAQEFAKSQFTPVDIGRLRQSFPATYSYNNFIIKYLLPFYAEYLNDGTKFITARHFIQRVIHENSERLLKQAFRITNKKYQ